MQISNIYSHYQMKCFTYMCYERKGWTNDCPSLIPCWELINNQGHLLTYSCDQAFLSYKNIYCHHLISRNYRSYASFVTTCCHGKRILASQAPVLHTIAYCPSKNGLVKALSIGVTADLCWKNAPLTIEWFLKKDLNYLQPSGRDFTRKSYENANN